MKTLIFVLFCLLFVHLSLQSEEVVKDLIENNKFVIFSKSYCPYCKRVKGLFQSLGVLDKAKIIELDSQQDGHQIQAAMSRFTKNNRSSVPQVFINQESIGGSDDTHALNDRGELVTKLREAGIL